MLATFRTAAFWLDPSVHFWPVVRVDVVTQQAAIADLSRSSVAFVAL